MLKYNILPLDEAALDQVVEIDRLQMGESRRGFYERRFAAAKRCPDQFIQLGAFVAGELAGFCTAHLLDGEFGQSAKNCVIDALGVDPDCERQGIGNALAKAILEAAIGLGAQTVVTQVSWTQAGLVHLMNRSGFSVAPRIVLERPVGRLPAQEPADGLYPLRTLREGDLDAVVRIDRSVSGRDNTVFYQRKFDEVLSQGGTRVSMVAESDGVAVGFVMARADYGEFGRTGRSAVLDTLGVKPDFGRKGIGLRILDELIGNLSALGAEKLRTSVEWNNFHLLALLDKSGFRRTQDIVLVRKLSN